MGDTIHNYYGYLGGAGQGGGDPGRVLDLPAVRWRPTVGSGAPDDVDSPVRSRHLSIAIEGAQVRSETYMGREHVVVPVIAMVGGKVVHPSNSEVGELVPVEAIARNPTGWNGRPVLADHPSDEWGAASANDPRLWEQLVFGQIFNAASPREVLRKGRLGFEAWLDPEKAKLVGPDAVDVVERVAAGKLVEVSVGALVAGEDRRGVNADGDEFGFVWHDSTPDHLAMFPPGTIGACSIEMGCGAPRVNQQRTGKHSPAQRAYVRSTARRPTFSGTESTEWSAPSFGDYLDGLGLTGDDRPGSVDEASADTRQWIAERTLLGEADAETFDELSFFPVVNPSNDNLNENALRAVLSGRGAQADIPESTLESARNMARRLLNEEYDADLEVTAAVKIRSQELRERLLAEGLSDNDLRELLEAALSEVESEATHVWVEAVFDSIVVYHLSFEEAPDRTYERDFSLEGAEGEDPTVSVGDERRQVVRDVSYKPVATRGREKVLKVQQQTNGDEPEVEEEGALKALARQFLDALKIKPEALQEEGPSVTDLFELLDAALEANVPGYLGISEVFPESSTVVYAVTMEDAEQRGPVSLFRRTYNLDEEGGQLTLNNDAEKVRSRITFEPLEGEAADDGDSPQETESAADDDPDGDRPEEGSDMKDLKQRVEALIESDHTPFKADDAEYLKGLSAERIEEIEADVERLAEAAAAPAEPEGESPAPVGDPAPEAETVEAAPESVDEPEEEREEEEPVGDPAPDTVQVPADEYAALKGLARKELARQESRKEELVSVLSENERVTRLHSKGDLAEMDLDRLEEIAALAGADEDDSDEEDLVRDYSGQGGPRVPRRTEKSVPKPPSLVDRVKDRRGGTA